MCIPHTLSIRLSHMELPLGSRSASPIQPNRTPNSPLAYRGKFPLSCLGNREEVHMSKPSDLVQGTLDLLVLKILALQPLHGWALSQRLKQVSGDVLQVSDGSLYPALHKLEHQGWIQSEWKVTENGRRAKFYSVTRAGRKALDEESANWKRLSAAIARVVRLKEA